MIHVDRERSEYLPKLEFTPATNLSVADPFEIITAGCFSERVTEGVENRKVYFLRGDGLVSEVAGDVLHEERTLTPELLDEMLTEEKTVLNEDDGDSKKLAAALGGSSPEVAQEEAERRIVQQVLSNRNSRDRINQALRTMAIAKAKATSQDKKEGMTDQIYGITKILPELRKNLTYDQIKKFTHSCVQDDEPIIFSHQRTTEEIRAFLGTDTVVMARQQPVLGLNYSCKGEKPDSQMGRAQKREIGLHVQVVIPCRQNLEQLVTHVLTNLGRWQADLRSLNTEKIREIIEQFVTSKQQQIGRYQNSSSYPAIDIEGLRRGIFDLLTDVLQSQDNPLSKLVEDSSFTLSAINETSMRPTYLGQQ